MSDGKLRLTAKGDREIVMTRDFAAPRRMVFDAYTKPELLRRWLGVRNGWSMPVCEVDLKVGGTYRFTWRKDDRSMEMTVRGVYREIAAPERIVNTEKFDDAWYPGEAVITTELVEKGGTTTLTATMRYDTTEARDAVLKSPMEGGVAESYDKLAELLAAR
jgi:uncharacterized protein YndB with AHSA1/START domain